MKTIKTMVLKMLGFFAVLTLITGVLYPALITGISNAVFPWQARGSILVGEDGRKYGSALVAQPFSDEKYLWGRVMNIDTETFTDKNGNPLVYGWASNKSPAGEELEAMIARRVADIRASQPEKDGEPIPVDLVTCSGSGLDPEISPAAAEFQVSRIAAARNMSEDEVRSVIRQYTTGRTFGLFGEPRVNVLKVNLTLDGIKWKELS